MAFPGSRALKSHGGCTSNRAGHCMSVVGLLVLALAVGAGSLSAGAATPAQAPLAGLPLFFEANCGQAFPSAQFVAHSRSGTVLLGPAEVVVLQASAQPLAGRRARAAERSGDRRAEIRTLSFQFVGCNPQAAMTGLDPLSGNINYILGDDPASWRMLRFQPSTGFVSRRFIQVLIWSITATSRSWNTISLSPLAPMPARFACGSPARTGLSLTRRVIWC